MKIFCTLCGIILLLLLVVDCSTDVNLKVKGDVKIKSFVPKNGNNSVIKSIEQKGGAKSMSRSIAVTQLGSEEDEVEKSKKDIKIDIDKKEKVILNGIDKDNEVVYKGSEKRSEFVRKDVDKRNVSEPLQSKDGYNHGVSKNGELKNKANDISGGSGEGSESKERVAMNGNKELSTSLTGVEKEKSRDEECDPSNMCIDQKKTFTACLRVPGNDSPDLSLLIQNKGSRPLTITIIAPNFVQLEERKVVLQQKEDKKLKVTIPYEGMDSSIFLTTEDSRCALDFKDLIRGDSRMKLHNGSKLRYPDNLTRTHWLIFLSISVLLLFGSAWVIINLRKRLFARNGYQSVDTKLPVLGSVAKTVSESNDQWDSGWGDNWDDEEAPMTPTLPVTPNLSSRGLSSRRLNKENWKD